ncbi:MAG: hypothetical protein ABSH04_05835 [Acidimicrobiales bacterium]
MFIFLAQPILEFPQAGMFQAPPVGGEPTTPLEAYGYQGVAGSRLMSHLTSSRGSGQPPFTTNVDLMVLTAVLARTRSHYQFCSGHKASGSA